jgi:hypothetical protein
MDRVIPLNVRVGPRGGIQRKSKTGHWYYSKHLPTACDTSCAKNIRALSMKRKKNTNNMPKKKKKSNNDKNKKRPFTIHIKTSIIQYRILIQSTTREAFYARLNKEFRARHGVNKSWHARTAWRINQHDRPREVHTCVYTIHMPDLSFAKSVPKAARQWMQTYIKDLLCHEHEHVELGRHIMTTVPFKSEAAVREAWREHNMAQKAFDIRSRHGCNKPQTHRTPFGTFQGECSINCRSSERRGG